MSLKAQFLICVALLLCVGSDGFDKLKAGTVEYGGTCDEDYECVHWRMYCNPQSKNCSCWRFHNFVINENGEECLENTKELIKWLAQVRQTHNFKRELENEAHDLFFYLGLSGILSLGLGLLFALGCITLTMVNHKSHHNK